MTDRGFTQRSGIRTDEFLGFAHYWHQHDTARSVSPNKGGGAGSVKFYDVLVFVIILHSVDFVSSHNGTQCVRVCACVRVCENPLACL